MSDETTVGSRQLAVGMETPRTDAENARSLGVMTPGAYVRADFARGLERELRAALAALVALGRSISAAGDGRPPGEGVNA
jgi:orotidine-5'-phosphate decarboxylase